MPGASVLVAIGGWVALCAAPAHQIIDLGTMDAIPAAYWAHGLNAAGTVVGHREFDGGVVVEAFRWDEGVMTRIGPPGGFVAAEAVNDRGVVVGTVVDVVSQAFVSLGGQGIDSVPLDSVQCTAEDVSRSIGIVGMLQEGGLQRAYLWEKEHGVTLLGSLGTHSRAYAINKRGQIVGWSMLASGQRLAFIWESGAMIGLTGAGAGSSWALDINDHGVVVGYTNVEDPLKQEAFAWDAEGGMVALGGTPSRANGVNNHGEIVGTTQGKAFMYRGGQMTDLLDLVPRSDGWTALIEAADINDDGCVVGTGIRNGLVRAYLIVPGPGQGSR
jgi:probable HAF family extracellular repeat protein